MWLPSEGRSPECAGEEPWGSGPPAKLRIKGYEITESPELPIPWFPRLPAWSFAHRLGVSTQSPEGRYRWYNRTGLSTVPTPQDTHVPLLGGQYVGGQSESSLNLGHKDHLGTYPVEARQGGVRVPRYLKAPPAVLLLDLTVKAYPGAFSLCFCPQSLGTNQKAHPTLPCSCHSHPHPCLYCRHYSQCVPAGVPLILETPQLPFGFGSLGSAWPSPGWRGWQSNDWNTRS